MNYPYLCTQVKLIFLNVLEYKDKLIQEKLLFVNVHQDIMKI
jgi:hypothetical protein